MINDSVSTVMSDVMQSYGAKENLVGFYQVKDASQLFIQGSTADASVSAVVL